MVLRGRRPPHLGRRRLARLRRRATTRRAVEPVRQGVRGHMDGVDTAHAGLTTLAVFDEPARYAGRQVGSNAPHRVASRAHAHAPPEGG